MSEFRRRLMMQSREDNPILKDYLTIVALEDGLTAKLSLNACEYCVDGDGNWKSLPADTETEAVNSGHTLSFRGNLTPTSSNGIGTFTISKLHNLKGNCMSMLFGDDGKNRFSLAGKTASFINLFNKDVGLVNACEFKLPATTLIDSCYKSMFANCTNLITAPELPATTLKSACYYTMFQGCKSLTTAPKLPATTLANSCYAYMFGSCTSLTTAPELPAKILAPVCYGGMFSGCTSLTTAPDLPAETLTMNCYYELFKGCSGISHIRMIATNISASNSRSYWVSGVAPSGTFIKAKGVEIQRGTSGIPTGWNVIEE